MSREPSQDKKLVAVLSSLRTLREKVGARLRSSFSFIEPSLSSLRRHPMLTGLLVVVGLTLSLAIYVASDVVSRLPNPHAVSSLEQMPEATVVYDGSGRPAFTFFREQRLPVPIERVSGHLLDAVLAIEDRRFYQHGGIDLVRVLGAAVADLAAGRIVEGGSTITQQLARQSLLSSEKTWGRKLAEILTAVWIENVYEKGDILELYLNKIYWGSGFYGVDAAARGYFGKPAGGELSIGEAALLAGMVQAPERYSPTKFPERAIARRNVVLDVMRKEGLIDERSYHEARRKPLRLHNGLGEMPNGGYFKETVRQQLVEMFGWDAVHEGGLRVYSTIDPAMQRAAEETLADGIHEIEALPTYRRSRRGVGGDARVAATRASDLDYLQGALIALDPVSGAVRALVGGRDFADSPFNRATQAHRQPGSAFKPLLYAAAIDHGGVSPTTILDDLDQPVPSDEGPWLPAENHGEASALTVREALRISSNRAAVRLLQRIGIDRTVDYAARFGLGPQPRVPSLALGSGSVTLESLTAAYAAFANQGIVPQPTYISRVTDASGKVLFEADAFDADNGRPAVEPATAFVVANLLRGVLDAGTGWTVRKEGFRAPAAGKTGTTDDYKDAWFIGFTPALAAGVWIGFDEPRTIARRGYGSDLAAPVWARFMRKAAGRRGSDEWIAPPPGVVRMEVCASSLAVASEACRRSNREASEAGKRAPTYWEYFVSGTEPVDPCPVHRSILAKLLAPFQRSRRPDRQWSETWEGLPGATTNSAETARVSIAVIHDHLVGSCAGGLVAGPDQLHYVTAHQDAFAIGYAQIARFDIDVETRHIELAVRGGRHYNFDAPSADREALVRLEGALSGR